MVYESKGVNSKYSRYINIKLETLCVLFSLLDIVFRTILAIFAISASKEFLLEVFIINRSNEGVDYNEFKPFIKPVIMVDCLTSIYFSVLLMIGVLRINTRYLNACFIYGIVVLVFALMTTVPHLFGMVFHNEFSDIWMRLFEAVVTAVDFLKVMVIYKTHQKFLNMDRGDSEHLVSYHA